MEAIGDSTCVNGEVSDSESVEFERNLDRVKETLENEENRLTKLEEHRVRLQQEIELMFVEITAEKMKYRQAVDVVIEEHEKISRDFLASCQLIDLSPIESSTSLLEDCASTIEAAKNLDFNIELDTEKTRCDLLANMSTKEDHLSTLKDHFNQREKKIASKADDEANRDSS